MTNLGIDAAFKWAFEADEEGDWEEAIKRWARVKDSHPDHAGSYCRLSHALLKMGRLDAAEMLVAEGLQRFACDFGNVVEEDWTFALVRHAAEIAGCRMEFRVAVQRWRLLLNHFPDNEGVKQRFGDAMMALQLSDATSGDGDFDKDAAGAVETTSLMLYYQSLGDNCEFGLVQRRLGFEPLDLLRWSAISPACLIDLLKNEAQGIGDIENTKVDFSSQLNELITSDTRYGMATHTFIRSIERNANDHILRLCKHLRFLSLKFVRDLRNAERVYIYRCDSNLEAKEAFDIYAALREFNPTNRLLLVKRQSEANIDNDIEKLDNGLVVGRLPSGAPRNTGEPWCIDFDSWISICRRAKLLLD